MLACRPRWLIWAFYSSPCLLTRTNALQPPHKRAENLISELGLDAQQTGISPSKELSTKEKSVGSRVGQNTANQFPQNVTVQPDDSTRSSPPVENGRRLNVVSTNDSQSHGANSVRTAKSSVIFPGQNSTIGQLINDSGNSLRNPNLSNDNDKSLSGTGTVRNNENQKGEIKKEIESTAKKKNSDLNATTLGSDTPISFKSLSSKLALAGVEDGNLKPEETSKRTPNASSLVPKLDPATRLAASVQIPQLNGTVASARRKSPTSKPKTSNDAILIGAAGGLFLVIGIIATCFWRSRRSKKSREPKEEDGFDVADIQSIGPGSHGSQLDCEPKRMPTFEYAPSPADSWDSIQPRTQNSTDPRPRRSVLQGDVHSRSVGSDLSSTRSFPVVRAYAQDHRPPSRQSYQASFFSEDYDPYDAYFHDTDAREDQSQSGRFGGEGSIYQQRY